MRGIVFYKMSGSGNDFVFVDGRVIRNGEWSEEAIRAVCARGTGVGADGFVVLSGGPAQNVVRFQYHNADGTRTELCGNAALCATVLAGRLEMADPDGMVLETDSGPLRTRVIDPDREIAEIAMPEVSAMTEPEIACGPGERAIRFLTVGVPHLVVMVDSVLDGKVDVEGRGRALRNDPIFAGGANVNFVGRVNGGWRMRTYERGVEAETLACGTGAVAVATALSHLEKVALPCAVRTSSGEDLEVFGDPSVDLAHPIARPRLRGQGRLIFRGILT